MLDKLYYLIDLLVRRMRLVHEPSKFFPLKADYLRAIIGPRYVLLSKTVLLTLGIIETNGSYKVGVQSIAYRLAKAFRSRRVRQVPITDRKLAARIERQSKRRFAEAVKGKHNLKVIARTLTMVTIHFDIADRYMCETSFPTPRAKETRINQLQAFREQDFYLSVDRQGRVHHNFVALSNDLKMFATIGEESLFAVDVGNMQPALLSLFYTAECDEKSRYVELVAGNNFYEFFNQRMRMPVDLNKNIEKKNFKRLLFKKYLFCHNEINHEIGETFRLEFPVLAKILQSLKTGCYQRLARRLQEIEASVVIEGVIKDLADTYPEMPLLSVHDCVVTTSPFVQIAEKTMKQKFDALLGFEIPVHTKRISSI